MVKVWIFALLYKSIPNFKRSTYMPRFMATFLVCSSNFDCIHIFWGFVLLFIFSNCLTIDILKLTFITLFQEYFPPNLPSVPCKCSGLWWHLGTHRKARQYRIWNSSERLPYWIGRYCWKSTIVLILFLNTTFLCKVLVTMIGSFGFILYNLYSTFWNKWKCTKFV